MKGRTRRSKKDKELISLVLPSSELSLVTDVKKKLQKKTDTIITIERDTGGGDVSNSEVNIEGTAASIQKAFLKLVPVLCQSEMLITHDCPRKLCDWFADWEQDKMYSFQREFSVFLEFHDGGGVTMKAWHRSEISRALSQLKEEINEYHTAALKKDLESSSDSDSSSESETSSDSEDSEDSDDSSMDHTTSFEVSGWKDISKKKVKTIEKLTGTNILISTVGDQKRPRTAFTVDSDSKKGTEAAVDELEKMLEKLEIKEKKESKKNRKTSKNKGKKNEYVSSDEEMESCEEGDEDDYHKQRMGIKLPDVMNILVLGETGVGKSTFINGLVNYLKCRSIKEALERGVEILIPSAFTLTDDNFETREIINHPTIEDEQSRGTNENLGRGQSATQDPKSYVFSWSDHDGPKKIRIIDTPGIGDTRGLDQDKKNFDKILSFISDFSELHAVCILIKPNTARLTLAFRFCIDELLVHLHKSASRNILFCFTNTRGTLYKPGDTLPTLREHLDKLKTHRGINIATDKTTLFSFDNESFRFLCACQNNFHFTETEKQNFESSWTKSVQETLRLFSRISELPVHSVHDTLCLNNTRTLILTMARPLAEIAKNQMINMKLIEDKMREVEDHSNAGRDLKDKLYVDQIMIRAEEIDFPQTVCTAAECVEHRRFNGNENAPMQTIYKSICHDHCYLQGVQVENCPNAALQQCWAMSGNGSNCRMCGCIWSTHMHIRYILHQTMERVVDPTVQTSIANKDDMVKTIEVFLAAEKQKVEQLRLESEKITSYCAEFASFLNNNSILPYNDSYKQYIEHLIKEEREKVAAGGSDNLLKEMEKYEAEYKQQVDILDSNLKKPSSSSRSVTDINDMVRELKRLQHCGSVLAEVEKLELLKVRQTQRHTGRVVALDDDNSWFAGAKRMVNKGKKYFKK